MASKDSPTPDSTEDLTNTTANTPTGTATQDPQPTMSIPSPPLCAHTIPPCLIPGLPTPTSCPSCIIMHHIADITDVQNTLRTRGGVFYSRGRPKSDKHRALMDRWRKAKVELLNIVSFIEISISDFPNEDWKDVKVALAEWEKEIEGLAKVPGYVYEGEQVKLSEEVLSLVNGMLEGLNLRSSMSSLLLEDGPEVVVAKEGETRDSPDSVTATSTSTCVPSSTSISIAVPEKESGSDSASMIDVETPSRSILKRKSTDHDPPPTTKRLRIADNATVSSDHLTISNPSPFLKLSTAVTTRPHHLFTFADHKRRKSYFSRSSESYMPGAWSSPAFCFKPNTSGFRLDWNEVEAMWKEEMEEVEEEKRVHERLRVIAECHVMSWWVRGVAGHVGLEKVVEIGRQQVEESETRSDGGDGLA